MTDRYRDVGTGFAADRIALADDEGTYRVHDRLTEAEYRALAAELARRPDAWLSLEDNGPDVEALVHFPGLRNLNVTSLRLRSWDGLRHVAESLEQLTMGDTTLRPISIAPMRSLRAIRSLALIGPVRDGEVIAGLTTLEGLSLRSVTLAGLSPLVPLRGLRRLTLSLGGTNDLALLPRLDALEELELWRIRGLADVRVVGELPGLRHLELQSMRAITELTSLRRAVALRRVALDAMAGLTDLRAIADAPALEELLLIAMNHLSPDALRPLVGHPTLRRGVWGLGSTRKNNAAYDLLPLGAPPYGHPDWRAVPGG